MNLRLVFLGATFLAGASAFSAANAADVYARGESLKDTPAYMPAITWTGFYVGAHIGGTVDDSYSADLQAGDEFGRIDGDVDSTWLAGVQLGYNWQTSHNLVLGLEGDFSFPFDSDEFGADFLASVRGRIGYAAGNALIYATGGVAFLDTNFHTDDETVTGFVVGGGLDYKIRQNVSVGVEALYYNFDDHDFNDGPISGTEDRDFWAIRARLNYHFGGDRYEEPLK